jgi:hypothetical protein
MANVRETFINPEEMLLLIELNELDLIGYNRNQLDLVQLTEFNTVHLISTEPVMRLLNYTLAIKINNFCIKTSNMVIVQTFKVFLDVFK